MKLFVRFAFSSFVVLLATGNQANASYVTLSATALDASVVIDSTDPSYVIKDGGVNDQANAITISPTYSDGTPNMTGAAGAAGAWNDALFGSTPTVYLGLDAAGVLAEFGTNDFTGIDKFSQIAYNDNDDIWGFDLWIETEADGRVSTSVVNINGSSMGAPNYAVLSLDLTGLNLSNVLGIGVSVHGDFRGGEGFPSSSDAFHASWSPVPEPTSMAIMGLGTLLAGFGVRRRKRKMAEEMAA